MASEPYLRRSGCAANLLPTAKDFYTISVYVIDCVCEVFQERADHGSQEEATHLGLGAIFSA